MPLWLLHIKTSWFKDQGKGEEEVMLYCVDSMYIAAVNALTIRVGKLLREDDVAEITGNGSTANGSGNSVQDLLSGSGAENGALSKPNQLVEDYGRGLMNISRNVFVYALAIGMVVAAIGFIVHGTNQQKLAENKSGLGWKIAGGILGFGAVSIVLLLETIGKNLFG